MGLAFSMFRHPFPEVEALIYNFNIKLAKTF